jgi:hypothetical protein
MFAWGTPVRVANPFFTLSSARLFRSSSVLRAHFFVWFIASVTLWSLGAIT